MTKDELTALRRERGKQELNIGDRVKAYDQDGTALYDGKVFEITGKGKCDNKFVYRLDGLMSPFYAEDLELVKQPTDEIKVGDRVVAHVGLNMDWIGTVKKIIPDTDGLYGENLLRIRVDEGCLLEHRVSRCTKINPDKEDKTGSTITIPVKVDLDDTYWDAYRAELVKEIAVKFAHDTMLFPADTAERVVRYADAIVDNLKKQSE